MGNALGILVLLWQAVPGAVSVECIAVEAPAAPVRVLRAVADGWQEEAPGAHAASVRHCARVLHIGGAAAVVGVGVRETTRDGPATPGFFRQEGAH